MKTPSRRMPPRRTPTAKATLATWLVIAGALAAILWGMIESMPIRWAIGGATILMITLTILHRRRLKRIREERIEESICSFARLRPARAHDTWVVRAVYEELFDFVRAPLRPSDTVEKFWGIDGEDLDDMAFRIAERAGRSMDGAQMNPLFGRVVTVSDMIQFFENQPKLLHRSPVETN